MARNLAPFGRRMTAHSRLALHQRAGAFMVQQTIRESLPFAYRYFERTNEILGMVGFAAAFACLGTENPVFYAFLSLLFIILAWSESFHRFKRRLDLLVVAGAQPMNKREVLKRCKIGFAGVLILSAVATGFLDKYGLNLAPDSNRLQLRTAPVAKTEALAEGEAVQAPKAKR